MKNQNSLWIENFEKVNCVIKIDYRGNSIDDVDFCPFYEGIFHYWSWKKYNRQTFHLLCPPSGERSIRKSVWVLILCQLIATGPDWLAVYVCIYFTKALAPFPIWSKLNNAIQPQTTWTRKGLIYKTKGSWRILIPATVESSRSANQYSNHL